MGDIGRGLSSQLSTAPYLTGGHYARSPGTGGKFTAPLPLAIGAMSWALNTLQPSLGATATTSAEKLSVVKAEVAFAFLLFLWGAYWNYRGHVRRLSRRAYAESAYPWTGNGKPEDFPQRDWTTASEPPYGWSLLELASSAGPALASSAEPALSPSAEPRRPPRFLAPPLAAGGARPLPPLALRVPNPFKPPWIYVPIIAILAGQSKTPAAMGGGDKQADFNYRMIYFSFAFFAFMTLWTLALGPAFEKLLHVSPLRMVPRTPYAP